MFFDVAACKKRLLRSDLFLKWIIEGTYIYAFNNPFQKRPSSVVIEYSPPEVVALLCRVRPKHVLIEFKK
jgi:hypothetical protein